MKTKYAFRTLYRGFPDVTFLDKKHFSCLNYQKRRCYYFSILRGPYFFIKAKMSELGNFRGFPSAII
jgi:hypothetical protein